MSDSISRQKVLATLDFADNALTDEERTVENYKELLTECIKVLPTAEDNGDLISRRAVLELVADYDLSMGQVVKGIHALPSVENKGEWISAKVGKLFPSNDYKCSICGNILDFDGVNCGRGDANYCPNCGADMREPKGEKIRCNTCKNNDDELSGECYECVKGIFDHYEKRK